MLKTAECVSPKHPDKICDRISDAILDACLAQDPDSRVAIETMGGHGIITVTGELTTKAYVDIRKIVELVVGQNYGVQVNIAKQSPNISNGVDTGGAGDQGVMVGYACTENPEKIPQELYLARSLCKFIYEKFPCDGKTQITLNGNDIETIVVSWADISSEAIHLEVAYWLSTMNPTKNTPFVYANPAGDWQTSGFDADTGVTGRKLACDNYGPAIPIGGGAFSGKDGTKVDRSGAYIARYLAVKCLDFFKLDEVIVKVAYAIGVIEPVMIMAQGKRNNEEIWTNVSVSSIVDYKIFEPREIMEFLKLKEPKFEKTAEWGAFGNGFDWDK